LATAFARSSGATVFGYRVRNPERYGVIEFDEKRRIISLEEKPRRPRSQWALTGLYCFDRNVTAIASSIAPSARGEYEITDVIRDYANRGDLHLELLGRGFAWLDTGTSESMVEAAEFVRALEKRQGLRIACPEEVAFQMKFIDKAQLERLGRAMPNSEYGAYLLQVAAES
jgi:glucose-1-phosphate thymidylyltransferase